MKQTATDYLYEQFISLFMQYTEDDTGEFNFGELITEAHEQAKAMENEQIRDAVRYGFYILRNGEDAEQSYNETFNQ